MYKIRPGVLIAVLVVAIMVLPAAAVRVRGIHGELELPPLTEGTQPQFYRAAEYNLDVGDRIDYSFSASDEVSFVAFYAPDFFPAPTRDKIWEPNVTHGDGVLEADWAGIYFFEFASWNPTASITVSYNIDIHESWLAEWGLALGITVAVVALVIAGIVIMRETKRKGI